MLLEIQMKKIWIYAAVLMLLASNTLASDLRINGEKISLYAKDEPLQDILRQMARQGIKVKIDPQLNPDISINVENGDIQKVIDTIVRPYNHVLIWEKPSEKLSGFKLSEIQVFTPGKQERIRDLTSPRTFSLSKSSKNGAVFVKDEILLRAKSRAAAEKIAKAIGGTITDAHEALGIYKVRLPADSDVAAISDKIVRWAGSRQTRILHTSLLPHIIQAYHCPDGLPKHSGLMVKCRWQCWIRDYRRESVPMDL